MRNKINLPTFIFNQYITKNNVPLCICTPLVFLVCATATMSNTIAIPVAETMSCDILLPLLPQYQRHPADHDSHHRKCYVHKDK
jgi:hypothetical protein